MSEYTTPTLILFEEDWNKNPHAIADINTTNKTWVRYSGLLKSMNISNHLFCLQLHNRELVGVDVLSDSLSNHIKDLILEEIQINPFYFFREVLRLSSVGETDVVMMDANRGNVSVWWLFFNYVVIYLIQIRQTGKSITIDGLFTLLNQFISINSSHVIITKDNTLRDENTERLKNMRNNLPNWLKLHGRGDLANTEKITVKAFSNEIKILLAQKSKIAANALGRGLTTHTFGIDEFGFMYNNDISVPAALTAGSRARENAIKNGLPCGTLFYTTPGYLSSPMGRFAHKYYKDGMQFTEELFDCKNREELHDRINKSNRGAMDLVIVERNHQQLGITDDELKARIKSAGLVEATIEAEMMNRWVDGSSDSVLDAEQIKRLTTSKRDITFTTYHNGYALNWYVPKHEITKDRVMIVGSDTSEMKGSDDTSLVVVDPITGETLGAGKYNKTNIIEYAQGVYDFMSTYYNTVMIIERKSTGSAILDYLLVARKEDSSEYEILDKLYYEGEVLDPKDPTIVKQIGFGTAGRGNHARSVLFGDVLEDSVDEVGNNVRDITIITQLTELEERNGRIDHPVGGNDDVAVGWLLAQWMLRFGKDLRKFGINPTTVLSVLSLTDDQLTIKKSKEKAMFIHKVTKAIDNLIMQLGVTPNQLQQHRIQAKITYLSGRLAVNSVKSMNIEERVKESLNKAKGQQW